MALYYTLMAKGFGEILVDKGLITQEQLSEAFEEQKRTGERIGQILVRRGYVSQQELGKVLETQVGVPYVNLLQEGTDPRVVKVLTEEQVRRFKALPYRREGNALYVAMLHPIDVMVVDELKYLTGMRIRPMITTERELQEAVNRIFDVKEKATQAIEAFREQRGVEEEEPEADAGELQTEDVPIVRLVDSILIGGIESDASDVHLEPQEKEMRVRYRVDGMLREHMRVPRYMERACISRVKVLAGMNIAERRLPQDGQFVFHHDQRAYDLRVATLPTRQGEKMVIRVLEKGKVLIGTKLLGMLPQQEALFSELILVPWGIFLVSGPTGSGKTTTLYAVLNELNDDTKNIVTVEDPVEFQLPGVNQMQVNPKAGMTFAVSLRAILRQDPNVVMVGEVRDEETAKISVHASLTGQMVLSTIHTTDAPSVLIRLLELGVEPYLVASTVVGVVSQRLVRIICSGCKEPHEPTAEEAEILRESGILSLPKALYRGKGCAQCNGTGFRGRTGIFEVMKMDRELRDLVTRRASAADMREAAMRTGMLTLYQTGVQKAAIGITTIEEVGRVAFKEV